MRLAVEWYRGLMLAARQYLLLFIPGNMPYHYAFRVCMTTPMRILLYFVDVLCPSSVIIAWWTKLIKYIILCVILYVRIFWTQQIYRNWYTFSFMMSSFTQVLYCLSPQMYGLQPWRKRVACLVGQLDRTWICGSERASEILEHAEYLLMAGDLHRDYMIFHSYSGVGIWPYRCR